MKIVIPNNTDRRGIWELYSCKILYEPEHKETIDLIRMVIRDCQRVEYVRDRGVNGMIVYHDDYLPDVEIELRGKYFEHIRGRTIEVTIYERGKVIGLAEIPESVQLPE